MEAYKIISDEVKECPFCKGTKIRYSVSSAANNHFYGQCYCDDCKAAGPRIRFLPEEYSNSWIRYAAEADRVAKAKAIEAWNKRE